MHGVAHLDRLPLDGRWRFQLLPAPDAGPTVTDWREIDVPSAWTLQGTGDRPHYTNVQMPWPLHPPDVPEANPTGLYERTFELPADWAHRRVVLHVGAAESVLFVTLNGEEVGISKDSHLAAEFDVTRHVRPGTNELVLRVVKWSDASYIEDQDQWWHGGITRSVYLYATGPVYLADIRADAGLDAGGATGTLGLRVLVGFPARGVKAGWTIQVRLPGLGIAATSEAPVPPLPHDTHASLDENALLYRVASGQVPTDEEREAVLPALMHRVVPPVDAESAIDLRLPGVRPWSAEDPHLETLEIDLRSPTGEVVETAQLRIGFRRVEVVGRDLLINGARVYIRGVNRHDFDQRTGRVVTRDAMREDLISMKQFGFNAVRTSHYPNDPAFLDLADELGLYVADEADIESHAFWGSLCDDPRYLAAWVERVARMVQRDRNHPSVIVWSLGNESGHGANHEAAAAWLRHNDPSRPLHYEGAIRFDWWAGKNVTDVVCPMYPPLSAMVAYAHNETADRPVILCEYSHAMGNSNGTLADYWDTIESTPGLQGGFIWEWWDHGLVQVLPDGRQRWAYGGDFGDQPNDGNFVLDGMVWPDRRPKPAMWEHKRLAAPVRLSADPEELLGGRVQLENRQHFSDLAWLRGRYELTIDGVAIAGGEVQLPSIGPGQRAAVDLPGWVAPPVGQGGEAWLTVRLRTADELAWAPRDFEVCALQLPLGSAASAPAIRDASDAGPELDAEGRLVHPLLAVPPTLSLWRAPTDNDRIGGMAARWVAWGTDRLERRLILRDREGATFVVRSEYRTGAGIALRHEARYTALAGGGVRVEESVTIPHELTDLARVGTVLEAVGGLESLEWFGSGPHETYPDRKRSGLIGRWRSTVAEQYVPYVRPQENGGHADVRWLELTGLQGQGLRVELERPSQVSVTHHRAADLAAATHDVELAARPEAILHIDAAHRGLGTASCGPDTLPEYLVGPGTYRWTWTIAPIGP